MKIFYALIICYLNIYYTRGQNKFATCDRAWTKIGCYNDKQKPSRPLPEMLLNDRDKGSKYHEAGYLLNWRKWRESLHSLACRCAKKARLKGYSVFGLQFFGECWSGSSALHNYTRDGVSTECIMNLGNPSGCVQQDARECVGQINTNYIYQLIESPGPQSPDIDGNYTSWSEWTPCSKSCGGGYKSRERTCTNPKQQGNGLPCDPRLGEPEETVKCNEQDCYECDKLMDVGIVVDSSSSVKRRNFEKVKGFLLKLVDEMHISYRMTHVSVIRYNQVAKVMWKFNDNEAQNRQALQNAIQQLQYKPGGTRTDKALKKTSEELSSSARPTAPHMVLVITDGKTHSRSEKYSQVLEPFRKQGVKIIAIGVGSSVDMNELKQIAMNDIRNVIKVSQFGKLVSRIHDILKTFCAARAG